MGGSGAGKSTLLNILCGKLLPQAGQITINGYDIHQEESEIEGILGFVPQDDLLLEEFTVFTNLYLNAKLCLSNLSEKELLRRVNQVLLDLDLEEIKHLKVGNPLKKYISGGQRKRLNIALELIREPSILFVDEPTSGLSSMGSEKVMLLLKEQALKGRLVTAYIVIPFIVVPQLLFSGVMIPFDRLNNLFDNPAYVPIIGEVMPSRWAYEAIAVHQFKGNKFTKELFEIEQAISNASYRADHIQVLKQKLNDVWYKSSEGTVPQSCESELELVKNEIGDLDGAGLVASFGSLEGFTLSGFNESVYLTAIDSLNRVREFFRTQKREAELWKNRQILELIDKWGGEEAFVEMKNGYSNKRLGPLYIGTYWFNLLAIWFSAIIFYISLYYDLLRKFTTWNQIRKLRKSTWVLFSQHFFLYLTL